MIADATPFGDFTNWCELTDNSPMGDRETEKRIQDARRTRLRAYIQANFPSETSSKGNVSAFSEAFGKKQSQMADVLDGRKPFGEKLARQLEKIAIDGHHPGLRFDSDSEAVQAFYGVPLTKEAVSVAADWARIRGPMRTLLQNLIQNISEEQSRDARKPQSVPVREGLQRPKRA